MRAWLDQFWESALDAFALAVEAEHSAKQEKK
jgi:hypothetical protein